MLKETHRASTTLPAAGKSWESSNRRPLAVLARAAVMGAAALGISGCASLGLAPEPVVETTGFEELLQSVVRIDVREMAFDEGTRRFSSGVGSGVILSADGMILTNAHVVTPHAIEIQVTLANLESVRASLVGWDHWTDLAVIKLDLDEIKRRNLTFSHADFGDSEELYAGQTVFAVGTPHGLTRTVTKGIISNTDRFFEATDGVRGYETGFFNTWLQTDAAINPGNSGGPLVDEDGKVVGINSRTYLQAENLGFAIPSNTAKVVAAKLLADGEVERSYIGIVPGALRDLENFFSLETNMGVLINSVDPGSPASRAGVRPGDILLAIDGARVDGRFPEQLPSIRNLIADRPAGSGIEFLLKRGNGELTISAETERLESRVGEEWAFEKWGMSVRKVSKAFARENRLPDEDGFIVIGTQSAFPADNAGISRGDIITKVNRETVGDLERLKEIYGMFEEEPQSILVEALRNRSVSFFVLKP